MKKILIVDDDRELRDAMKLVLSTLYELREAGTKDDGLRVALEFKPDLVISDVMMESDSAGFEFARAIRAEQSLSPTKILMVTGVDDQMNMDFKSEAGNQNWLPVDDYVMKPCNAHDLLAKVQKLI